MFYFQLYLFSSAQPSIDALYYVFRSSSDMHIHCWLHCVSYTLANVYSEYILYCRFDTYNLTVFRFSMDACDAVAHIRFRHLGQFFFCGTK
jgi:hypothetical protein